MAYWEWGDPQAAHVVVCVHGLTRQGRDFDVLASALLRSSPHPVRVICPDVVGRGESDWLTFAQGYQIPLYVADMLALLLHLKPQTLDWLGTSMGGLIGLGVCAHAASVGLQVRKLVLNDVGPAVTWDGLTRIANYLGKDMEFDSVQAAADGMWSISKGFGPHTPQQWLALSRPMLRELPDRRVRLHYDPAIALAFQAMQPEAVAHGEALLWQMYDGIRAETLLVRGAESDLLLRETALEMTQRGPKARLLEFAGVGHAPTFVDPVQHEAVARFLWDGA